MKETNPGLRPTRPKSRSRSPGVVKRNPGELDTSSSEEPSSARLQRKRSKKLPRSPSHSPSSRTLAGAESIYGVNQVDDLLALEVLKAAKTKKPLPKSTAQPSPGPGKFYVPPLQPKGQEQNNTFTFRPLTINPAREVLRKSHSRPSSPLSAPPPKATSEESSDESVHPYEEENPAANLNAFSARNSTTQHSVIVPTVVAVKPLSPTHEPTPTSSCHGTSDEEELKPDPQAISKRQHHTPTPPTDRRAIMNELSALDKLTENLFSPPNEQKQNAIATSEPPEPSETEDKTPATLHQVETKAPPFAEKSESKEIPLYYKNPKGALTTFKITLKTQLDPANYNATFSADIVALLLEIDRQEDMISDCDRKKLMSLAKQYQISVFRAPSFTATVNEETRDVDINIIRLARLAWQSKQPSMEVEDYESPPSTP